MTKEEIATFMANEIRKLSREIAELNKKQECLNADILWLRANGFESMIPLNEKNL
jgi:hypothetical protein